MMLSQVRNSLLEKSLDNCMNHRSGYRHVLTRTEPRVGTESERMRGVATPCETG